MKTISLSSRRFAQRAVKLLLSGAVALQLALAFAPQAQAAPQQAKKADDFVDSIGILFHAYNYEDAASWTTLRAQMGAMGIRFYRSGLEHVNYPIRKTHFQDLYDSYGMRMLAVVGPSVQELRTQSDGSLSQVPGMLASVKPLLLAVEGPNEPEYFWDDNGNYGGAVGRAAQAVAYQNKLYDTVKGDSRTSDLQVTTFATAAGETPGNWYGAKPLIKHDAVAYHHYNYNNVPNPYDTLTNARIFYSSGNKPAYLTEHGYKVTGRGDRTVTLKGQMKLDTRSMALFWDNASLPNSSKMFFYLAGKDTAAGEDYGFDNADLSPRPVYTSIKNVLNYLKEATWNTSSKTWGKPAFTAGSLDYSVSGETADYGWRLLQKSNGDFYLMALPYTPVTNTDGTDINNAPRSVTISFANSQKVTQYKTDDLGNYTETLLTNGAKSVSIALPDTLMIFKISAGAAIPDGSNLVTNPGFENEQYGTQTPSGWMVYNALANASFTETNGGGHGGNYHGTHWSGSGAYQTYTSQTKTGLANGLYTLKAWVKSSGGQTTCQLEAKDFGANTVATAIPATSTWTQLTIPNINVTNGQCTFGIWSNAAANQWCYFDDLEFYKQITVPIGQRISLKALNNNLFVMSNQGNGSNLQALATVAGSWEKFDVVDAGGGFVALKAAINGLYVMSDQSNGGTLKATAGARGSWETFTWQDLGSNTFALKANVSNLFVQNNTGVGGGTLIAQSSTINDNWQKFLWAPSP